MLQLVLYCSDRIQCFCLASLLLLLIPLLKHCKTLCIFCQKLFYRSVNTGEFLIYAGKSVAYVRKLLIYTGKSVAYVRKLLIYVGKSVTYTQ